MAYTTPPPLSSSISLGNGLSLQNINTSQLLGGTISLSNPNPVNALIQGGTQPTNPPIGTVYLNSSNQMLQVYTGAAYGWVYQYPYSNQPISPEIQFFISTLGKIFENRDWEFRHSIFDVFANRTFDEIYDLFFNQDLHSDLSGLNNLTNEDALNYIKLKYEKNSK